jgi:ADP-ribosyl-[dinitrogen reductase] hydrolase
MSDDAIQERFRGCLVGLACGDAVGTTLEFKRRGTFTPIADMVGGGPFQLEPGHWTDDTSMALCLAESLLRHDGFDPVDQMGRYVNWWRNGYLSSTGECFDIGVATREALEAYCETNNPFAGSTRPDKAGNGSLMRLAPVAMFYQGDTNALIHHAAQSSRTTHGAPEAVESCVLFAQMLSAALAGKSRDEILFGPRTGLSAPNVLSIARGDYVKKPESGIVGSGYCIASLEAAAWCFLNTDSFPAAVLAAANLGDDADTTAAITGQIAGAFYGVESIPGAWRSRLAMGDEIDAMARNLFLRSESRMRIR